MMSEVLAMIRLLPERHAEVREEHLGVFVGPRRRDDADVHAAHLVHLVVDDLGEDQLLPEPERIVAAAVEGLGRHAAEIAHARQRDVDEAVEELVHPGPPERHLGADRHALAQLEVRDRLLGLGDDGLLAGDRLQVGGREVENLGVLAALAHPHIDDDLLEARHLVGVAEPALFHDRLDHGLVEELLEPAPRRLVAPAADDQDVGERQRALALDDAALPELLRRPLVLLHHVELFHQHPSGDGQHPQHLAALAPLLAGDDRYRVATSHVNLLHQMTSGASEMILVNCRSRSSRATGPKMRVPTGFSSGLIRTTALRSNRIYDPSPRRTSLTVLTTTARATSPFFTVPSGAASLTATMTVSPSEA